GGSAAAFFAASAAAGSFPTYSLATCMLLEFFPRRAVSRRADLPRASRPRVTSLVEEKVQRRDVGDFWITTEDVDLLPDRLMQIPRKRRGLDPLLEGARNQAINQLTHTAPLLQLAVALTIMVHVSLLSSGLTA